MQHHGKSEILRGLDPANPDTIQALIDFHRSAFGGWTMAGEDGGDQAVGDGGDSSKPDGGDPKGAEDKPLGPNGESALKAEREARKALESQFNQLKQGIAAALGVKDADAKSSSDDVLASVQKQLASLQHDNLVLSVANTNQITDQDDLDLMRSIKDEDALRKLAARLKPSDKADGTDGQKKRTPGPDSSQGRGAGSNGPRGGGLAAGAEMFASRKKPTTTP